MESETKDRLTKFGKTSLEILVQLGGSILVAKGASHYLGDHLYVQVPAVISGFKTSGYLIDLAKYLHDKEHNKKPSLVYDVLVPVGVVSALGKVAEQLNLP